MTIDNEGNIRVCHNEHHGGVILTGFSDKYIGACEICDLEVAISSEVETEITMVRHIARVHPLAFEIRSGYPPTKDNLQRYEYLIREGLT